VLSPAVNAAVTADMVLPKATFGNSEPADLQSLVYELASQVEVMQRGDTTRIESMLLSQAHTLDALFHKLVRQALDKRRWLEALPMGLGLRAQSQARATLEALAAMKGRGAHVTYVGQANIAHGPQQVNNGAAAPANSPRTAEAVSPQPQLLEHQAHEQWLDTGATGAAAAGNPAMAPVGAIDRPQDTRRPRPLRRR
jgi:hypothetical protein